MRAMLMSASAADIYAPDAMKMPCHHTSDFTLHHLQPPPFSIPLHYLPHAFHSLSSCLFLFMLDAPLFALRYA